MCRPVRSSCRCRACSGPRRRQCPTRPLAAAPGAGPGAPVLVQAPAPAVPVLVPEVPALEVLVLEVLVLEAPVLEALAPEAPAPAPAHQANSRPEAHRSPARPSSSLKSAGRRNRQAPESPARHRERRDRSPTPRRPASARAGANRIRRCHRPINCRPTRGGTATSSPISNSRRPARAIPRGWWPPTTAEAKATSSAKRGTCRARTSPGSASSMKPGRPRSSSRTRTTHIASPI